MHRVNTAMSYQSHTVTPTLTNPAATKMSRIPRLLCSLAFESLPCYLKLSDMPKRGAMQMSDSKKPETEKTPKPIVIEIRKLDKLETTYVRGCTG
jgi:hypothetical protein